MDESKPYGGHGSYEEMVKATKCPEYSTECSTKSNVGSLCEHFYKAKRCVIVDYSEEAED